MLQRSARPSGAPTPVDSEGAELETGLCLSDPERQSASLRGDVSRRPADVYVAAAAATSSELEAPDWPSSL